MPLAIAFIGTSKYATFFDSWYKAAKKFLAPEQERTFLVFSDQNLQRHADVVAFHVNHAPWPLVTLKRWETIERAYDIIASHRDFLYLDADMIVVRPISRNELFGSGKKYVGVHDPSHWMKASSTCNWPGDYETNPNSLAAVVEHMDRTIYWQGCLWGGKSGPIIGMLSYLKYRTQTDLDRGIIAKWHDESFLNRYYIERKQEVFTLGPEYAYPAGWSCRLGLNPRIIHVEKNDASFKV